MHILIVAPEQIPVPPPRGGSVEICIYAIAKRLARHHRVTVVSRAAKGYPARTERGNMTIVRVPSGGTRTYLASVLRYMRGRSFDWIQVDNRPRFLPQIKAQAGSTPVSIFLHSLTFVSKPMISRESAARCLKSADLIVANSASVKSELKQRFPAVASKLRVVHLGVDLSQFHPLSAARRDSLRRKYGLEGSFVVLFAGRVIPRKGVPVLLKAMARVRRSVPRAKVVVAGGAQHAGYIGRLKGLAGRLGVPTRFLGRLSHSRMREAYGMADCFVCPSQKHEAFGLVNVEAMAMGLPVVASSIGGIKEIIRSQDNGFLIARYREPSAFAETIGRLAREPGLARRVGERARDDVRSRFGWGRTAESLLQLYRI